MKSTKNLRLQLRLMQAALLGVLALATTAAVSTRQLLLDASNQPTSVVSLSGSNWTGTLDAARLPAALILDTNVDPVAGIGGYIKTENNGGSIDTGNGGGAIYTGNNGGVIYTYEGGGNITTYSSGGHIDTSGNGGYISTTSNGGYIATNGFGAPTDTGAPLGSLYCDQDPTGASGHVLWVMEPAGWVGK